MTHQATIPRAVRESGVVFTRHPIINQVFYPDRGWRRYNLKKRISGAWCQNHLLPEGVTHVQITDGFHFADFTVKELLKI